MSSFNKPLSSIVESVTEKLSGVTNLESLFTVIPGFSKACEIIKSKFNVNEVYNSIINGDCDVLDDIAAEIQDSVKNVDEQEV